MQDALHSVDPHNKRPQTYLPQLLQHQGKDPEVQDNLCHGGAIWGWGVEVKEEDVGEEDKESEVHDDVAQEDGYRGTPEAPPAAE